METIFAIMGGGFWNVLSWQNVDDKKLCDTETDDDEKTDDDDDDIDSIISPGTEDTNIRSSVGGQSREKDGYGDSESGLIETRSYHEDELQDKGRASP